MRKEISYRNVRMAAKPEDNKSEDLKEFIGMLARSDAKHDFKDVSVDKTIDSEFENINKGLAGVERTDVTDEQGCFNSVVRNPGPHYESIILSEMGDAIAKTVVTGYIKSDGAFIPTNETYELKCIFMEGKKGKDLRHACGLSQGAALIVDFNQNGFLNELADGLLDNLDKPIYVITNSETMNDAAPKTKYNDPTIFKDSASAPLISLIDLTKTPIIYSAWDESNRHKNNMFLTSYQYEISALQIIKNIFGKVSKLTTNVTVNDKHNNIKRLVVKDSRINNSKIEILKKIRSLFNKFSKKPFEINEGLQRKRLGDWGQALSCFSLNGKDYFKKDLKTKYYKDIVFRNEDEGGDTTPVYFVTHDYIAAAYALFVGANVIFILNKRIYIFKQTVTELSPYEIMLNKIRENGNTKNPIKEQLFALYSYDIARDKTIKLYVDDITDKITKFKKYLNDNAPPYDPIQIKTDCLTILKSAYILHQFSSTTPDVKELIRLLNIQKDEVPEDADNAINRRKITTIYELFSKAKNINNKYNAGELSEKQINNIKKSQIFLSIVHWTYEKPGIMQRLGYNANGIEISEQDKYAFLPFLSSSDKSIKKNIVSLFKVLYDKILATENDEDKKFFVGTKKTSKYQFCVNSFKTFCQSVFVFLDDGEKEAGVANAMQNQEISKTIDAFKTDSSKRMTELNDISGTKISNLLSLKEIMKEKKYARTEQTRDIDIEAQNDLPAVAPVAAPKPLRRSERIMQMKPKEESPLVGGSYIGQRVLDTNSINEITDLLLTSHMFIKDKQIGQNYAVNDPQAVGGAIEDNHYPYVPIYISLMGLTDCISELKNHSDYEYYIHYFLILFSMTEAIKHCTHEMKADIALGLREVLVTYISTYEGRNHIKQVFDSIEIFHSNNINDPTNPHENVPINYVSLTNGWFDMFAIITTSLTSHICGTFTDYDNNDTTTMKQAQKYINNLKFKRYLRKVYEIYNELRNNPQIETFYNINSFLKSVEFVQNTIEQIIIAEEPAHENVAETQNVGIRNANNLNKRTDIANIPYNHMRSMNNNPISYGGRRRTWRKNKSAKSKKRKTYKKKH